jgi:hypothetical protein
MNIAQLPPDEEDAQISIIFTILSKDLTTYRAQLKKAVSTFNHPLVIRLMNVPGSVIG